MDASDTRSSFNSRREMGRVARSLWATVVRNPKAFTCFTVYWIWMIITFQGTMIYPSVVLVSGLVVPGWFIPLMFMAVFFIAMALWFRRTRKVFSRRWYIVLIGATMSAGTVMGLIWLQTNEMSTGLYVASSVLLAFGTTLLYSEMNRLLGYLGMQQTLYLALMSILCATVAVVCISCVGTIIQRAVYAVSPAVIVLFYYLSIKDFPRRRFFEHGKDASLYMPWKFVCTSFTQGLTFGVLCGSLLISDNGAIGLIPNALSYIIAVLFLSLVLILLKLDFNMLIYQLGFFIMAMGYLVLACFPALSTAGGMLQTIGYCIVDTALWALGSYLIKTMGLPATWIAVCPSGALMIGLTGGSFIGAVVVQSGLIQSNEYVLMTVLACLLLSAALFMSNSSNFEHGWGTIRPGSDDASADSLSRVCAFISDENGLTPRETDVLLLLAHGKNRKAISKELFVSEETVKTHIRGVYQKLSIHSQEELDELIAASQETIGKNGMGSTAEKPNLVEY